MAVKTKYHLKKSLLETIDMTAQGRTTTTKIGTNKVFSAMELVVTASFSGTANIPAEGGAPSILNLIEEIHIRRNGDKKSFAASGKQLYYNHFRDTGVAPYAVPVIGEGSATDATYTAVVDWRFDAPNVLPYAYSETFGGVGKDQFGLDLRDEVNLGYLNKSVDILVQWAEKGKVIGTAVDSGIVSAKIEVYGIEKIYPLGVAATARHWEHDTRRETVSVAGSPNIVHNIPRVVGQQLMDIMVVAEEGRASAAFDPDKTVNFRHNDHYTLKDYPVRNLRAESWDIRRHTIPDNVLFFNLLPNHDLKAGVLDGELRDQPLTIEIPMPIGSSAAAVKDITVHSRFAKVPQVT